MSETHWYILRAVSGQEKKVKGYLEKEISIQHLQEYILQVLTPSEKVYQMRKSKDGKTKKIAIERNFFPGYVLVQANIANGEILHTIRNVPGVLGFLAVDGENPNEMPRPMRESEITRILGKVADTDEYEVKHELSFMEGEKVKVVDGPFSGFSAVVEEVYEDKKKMRVIVTIFGRNTPVELNFGQVEKED